jgi:hypothetical protein
MVEKTSRVDDKVELEFRTERIASQYKIPEALQQIQLNLPGVFELKRISVSMRRWGYMGIAYELNSIPFKFPDLKTVNGIIYPGTQSEGAVWGNYLVSAGAVNKHFAINAFVLPRVPADENVVNWWKARKSEEQLNTYITPGILAENVKENGLTDQVCQIVLGIGPFGDSDQQINVLLPSESPSQSDLDGFQQNIDAFVQLVPQRFADFTGLAAKQWEVASQRPIISYDNH